MSPREGMERHSGRPSRPSESGSFVSGTLVKSVRQVRQNIAQLLQEGKAPTPPPHKNPWVR